MPLLQICPVCQSSAFIEKIWLTGTALSVTRCCPSNHATTWSSQPKVNGMFAGNLFIASSVVLTGGLFTQIKEMFGPFNMPFLSYSTFLDIQSRYIFPAVHSVFKHYQNLVVTRSKESLSSGVDIVGDGRCDSPGFSAKYGTYIVMDGNTNEILHFYVIHREIAGNSGRMEKEAMIKCLDKLDEFDIKINSLTTDRHKQIRKYMREQKPMIKH